MAIMLERTCFRFLVTSQLARINKGKAVNVELLSIIDKQVYR